MLPERPARIVADWSGVAGSMLRRALCMGCLAVLLTSCSRSDERGTERAELNPPASAYTQAAPCSEGDASCQTLLDMYERKPGFKEQLVVALDAAGLARPLWMDNALSTRLIRTTYRNTPLLIGHACEPRNCAQVLYVAYDTASSRLFGFYRTNERVKWFGDPDEGEKARLCEEEPLCSLEPLASQLPAALARWSYPVFSQPVEFTNCTEYKGGMLSKDGFICGEQLVPQCPYGSAGCTVGAQFVGDQLASVSFKYKTSNASIEELKKAFNKVYGAAETTVTQPDPAGKLGSWVTLWRDGRVEMTLRRVRGVNAQGQRYDDTWMIFVDKAFPLFN